MTRIEGLNPLSTSRTMSGPGATGIESSEADHSSEATRAAGRQDVLALSSRGRVVGEAALAVHRAPDIRADKVLAIKTAIADGTYTSNAREIAQRLMANAGFAAD